KARARLQDRRPPNPGAARVRPMTRNKKKAPATEPWGLPLFALYGVLLAGLGYGLMRLVGVFGLPAGVDLSDPLRSLPAALALLALVVRLEGRPIGELGFSFHDGMYVHLAIGFGVAAALGLLAWGVPTLFKAYVSVGSNMAAGDIAREGSRAVLLLAALAAAEEAMFRGVLQRFLSRRLSIAQSILCTSLLFAMAHGIANPAAPNLGLLGVAVAGGMLGLAYARSGSLWLSTGLHLGWNLAIGFLAGLPVSGQSLTDTLFHTNAVGSPLLTGGDYGPEASL